MAPGSLRNQGKNYFAYSDFFSYRLLIKNKHIEKPPKQQNNKKKPQKPKIPPKQSNKTKNPKQTKKPHKTKYFLCCPAPPEQSDWDRAVCMLPFAVVHCVHLSSSGEDRGMAAHWQHVSLTILSWNKGRGLKLPVQSGNRHRPSSRSISETSKIHQWVRLDSRRPPSH